MLRTTIDFGIDLGTTNSAIAIAAGPATEIIKNNLDADTTPSAVHINRTGNLWVGQSARSKLADERAEHDVHIEFKRRMGTAHEHLFRSSGRKLLPEELSAEILKSLRADVGQKRGEDITAAVLTVPAAFGLHQCDATKRAAALAGYTHAPLLQEPIAAALAYGFQKHNAKAYWLVFDFGGGTFDAALVRSEQGTMSVVNHAGDNFLGGTDIDWAIVEQFIVPKVREQFRAHSFGRGHEPSRYDLLRLKTAVETAKIDLSRQKSTWIEVALHSLGLGTNVLEFELTRENVAVAARPSVLRAVDITRRVLTSQGIEPAAVGKLVFVGGPTLAPYFRDLVAEQLNIPFDLSVDPLTVVARGAAIFASGQRIAPTAAAAKPKTGAAPGFEVYGVELIYKPIGTDAEPKVGGKVSPPAGGSIDGCSIEFINTENKWRSGRLPLGADGAFRLNLRAEPNCQNRFTIELHDSLGASRLTEPAGLHYTIGLVVEEQTLIHNLGVALADNQVAVHFLKGAGLPAKSTKSFRTTAALSRNTSGSLLRIPVVEGDHRLADRNFLIGTLEISAGQIHRDLPLGTEIEVTLHMDASRLLHVVAYVPLLDEEFPAKLELGGSHRQPALAVLQAELGREVERVSVLRKELGDTPAAADRDAVVALEKSPVRAHLEAVLNTSSPDFDTLLKAEHQLLEFKLALDAVSERLAWPTAVRDAKRLIGELQDLVKAHGEASEQARAQTLIGEAQTAVAGKQADRLRKKTEELTALHESILYRQPDFWKKHFAALVECRDQMSNLARADVLIKSGRHALTTGNHDALIDTALLLQDLLPPQVVVAARRGYGSSLLA
jgi:molecular chaperone DnaK